MQQLTCELFFVSLLLMPLSMALAGPALVSLLVVYFGRMPSDEIAHPLDQPTEATVAA
ncbi:hypothetical protein EV646_112106 [Kribbella antiqua]|uniref:Uncharacterized protein n=1 Tax=Kribbella antiqua TaxID=2512217 RepID=A0A4V2S399_9ACTN|nr:hypothetical protein [Kribbella antiqua]TCO43530.1 hypothetical protein EV646_112106 [Kribbella antiqua]